MIDRHARDRYAQFLRHFAAGRVTNFDYEDQCDSLLSADRAIDQVHAAMWYAYDDIRRHTMTGKWALTAKQRRLVAGWIMFLYSDLEYLWPIPGLGGCLLNLLTLGLWRHFNPTPEDGRDRTWWPFFREEDFDRERRRPRLLAGGRPRT
jgi:hypothetical protein